jgi:hypothetical protein
MSVYALSKAPALRVLAVLSILSAFVASVVTGEQQLLNKTTNTDYMYLLGAGFQSSTIQCPSWFCTRKLCTTQLCIKRAQSLQKACLLVT